MNLVTNPSKRMLVALAATFLFSLATAQAQNSQPAASETTARPLNMLVLGDSIAWE